MSDTILGSLIGPVKAYAVRMAAACAGNRSERGLKSSGRNTPMLINVFRKNGMAMT